MADDGRVLIVGGTGMLGGQVVTELLSRGKWVRALVRSTSDATRLEQAGVEIARGDMMDPPSLLRAMDRAEAVVTTAAGYTGTAKVTLTRLTGSATATSPTRRTGPASADSY
jgi:uncharacterized protein YbjT (DUF2867 family)